MKLISRVPIHEILTCLVILFSISETLAQNNVHQPPNIVYILADDLGYGDLGCYGQKKIKTPHIDALAAKGKTLTSFYAGSTVCAPSRAALMTGKHTGHVSIRGNGEFPLPAEEKIIPEVLKQRGYINGMMGKWGLGLPGTSGTPEIRGWDYFSGHVHHVEGHFQRPDSAWQIDGKQLQKIAISNNLYANEWFTNKAIEFIHAAKKQPFFLYLSYTLPHAELVVPEKYMQPYLSSKGESVFAPETPHPAGLHYGAQSFPKAAYAAMVTQLDDYVGRVVNELEQLGLSKHTIIIFTSDNGTHKEGGRVLTDATDYFQSSGPFKGIKRELYEGGIRVPFIVRWDGNVAPGSSSATPMANWDMLATFAGITEAAVSNHDGIAVQEIWTGKKSGLATTLENRPLYWEFYEQEYKQAVRKGPWKAIRYYQAGKPQRTELFDLNNDPGERTNLSTKHPDLVKKMEQLMEQMRTPSENAAFQIN